MQRSQSALSFRALGTDAQMIAVAQEWESASQMCPLLHRARRRIDELEQLWSRFAETSEVSRLNHAAGEQVEVSVETLVLVAAMQAGWKLSGGRFDATPLNELESWGYDRTFAAMPPTVKASSTSRPVDRCADGMTTVEIDWSTSSVQVSAGVRLDPGGIGEGLAADLVCAEAMAGGAAGCCINLGGDVRMLGHAPEGHGWSVAVQDPRRPEQVLAVLGIAEGAVASSATTVRQWRSADGQVVHHLIDPTTGKPVDNELLGVTVVTDEAWRAEVLTKTAFIAGAERGQQLLEAAGVAAFLVESADVRSVGDIASFIR